MVVAGFAPGQATGQSVLNYSGSCEISPLRPIKSCSLTSGYLSPIEAPEAIATSIVTLKTAYSYPGGVAIGDSRLALDCLAKKESSNNPLAYNPMDIDGLPAFGLLQFKRDTFFEQCVQRFGFPDDIWDGQIQMACASLMLEKKQDWRWPPLQKCL